MRWTWLSRLIFLVLCGLALAVTVQADDGETQEEEEVVVTATRIPVLLSESPGTVQVITAEELARNPGARDLAEFLALWLGVQINATGFPGGVTTLGMRGAGSQQMLVMLNGVPIASPQTGLASLSYLPLGMVERVEIVQGPLTALYGDDAMGGVINVITRGAGPGSSLVLGAQSPGRENIQLSCGGERSGFSLGFLGGQGDRPNSDYAGNWQLVSAQPSLGAWQLDLGYYRYADDKGIPGPTYAPSLTARGQDGQEVLFLAARRPIAGGDALFRLYQVTLEDSFADEGTLGNHEAYRLGLEGRTTLPLRRNLTLVTVGKWERTGVDSDQVGEHTGVTVNVAAQLAWSPLESLQIFGGDLWSSHTAFGTSHSPSLGLVYRASEELVLKGSYSSAWRIPTFNELYWPADPWSQGNPELRPEEAGTWEVGLEYQQLDRWFATLTIYHTGAENLIEWLPLENGDADPWNDPWTPQNHGRVSLDGLDASVTWHPAPRWRLQGQLHLLRAREFDPSTGDYSLTLESKVPASAALAAIYGGEGFQAAWFTRFYQGHGEISSAAICDFSATLNLTAGSTLRLGLLNVWDLDYAFISGYPMPGRTLSLEWNAVF